MAEEVLDLTAEQPEENRLITLPQTTYTPAMVRAAQVETATEIERTERTRERLRGGIAVGLIVSLLAVVVFTLWYVIANVGNATDDIVRVIQAVGAVLLTPVVGLIGAVTGFYYGGQASGQQTTTPPNPGSGGRLPGG